MGRVDWRSGRDPQRRQGDEFHVTTARILGGGDLRPFPFGACLSSEKISTFLVILKPISRSKDVERKMANRKTTQNETQVMTNKFDETAKGLAQSVTRRVALKKCG